MTIVQLTDRVLLLLNEADFQKVIAGTMNGADMSQVDRYITEGFETAWREMCSSIPKHWLPHISIGKTSDDRDKTTITKPSTDSSVIPAGRSAVDVPVIDDLLHSNGDSESGVTAKVVPNIPDDGTGVIKLTGAEQLVFLIASLKMKGWHRSAIGCYGADSEMGKRQESRFTRGNPYRPITVKDFAVADSSSQMILRYYSLPQGVTHEIESLFYIPLYEGIVSGEASDANREISSSVLPVTLDVFAHYTAAHVLQVFGLFEQAQAMRAKGVACLPEKG